MNARRPRRRALRTGLRVLLAAVLGLSAALLVSCGGSGKGLIPTADAGPLQSDFEAVSEAAQTGDGDCTATETALAKTEQDYDALPTSVDAGLRTRLREGITNLHGRALALCTQPIATPTTGTTATTTTTATTPTTTTPTTTATSTTPATPPPATTPESETPGTGGGTEAKEPEGQAEAGGVGPGGTGPPGQEKKLE
ncbi:MAG TPA: hypothetical protein VFW29_08015 [Solirubrobacteraceae bacterium]|nr:hypothetical protein [Solirubrobacteraceae bacterium]